MTTIYIVLPLLFLILLIGMVYWEMKRKRMHTKARIRAWRERGVPAKTELASSMGFTPEPVSETRIAPQKKRLFLLPTRTAGAPLNQVEKDRPDSRRSYRGARGR